MAQARKLRAFCKWMLANGIQYSDGLEFTLGNGIVSDIGVKALYDFHEGELIATIPKQACLTVKTSGAAEMIEEAQLAGGLGLAVALMYEKSRKERSPWYEYLLLLPSHQALPIVWEPQEIDSLLGTELHAAGCSGRQEAHSRGLGGMHRSIEQDESTGFSSGVFYTGAVFVCKDPRGIACL